MKTIIIALLSFLSIGKNDIVGDITNNLKNGNINKITSYFNKSIELSITGNEDTYSKTQAEMIVKDFFKNNPIKTFTLTQRGTNHSGSEFINGKLETKLGIYKIYMLLKSSGNSILITEMHIEL